MNVPFISPHMDAWIKQMERRIKQMDECLKSWWIEGFMSNGKQINEKMDGWMNVWINKKQTGCK